MPEYASGTKPHQPASPSPWQPRTQPNSPLRIGRPLGARNKIPMQMQDAIRSVFMGLGGWEAMMEWARSNPDMFYGQVVPKLLPSEMNNKGPHKVEVIITPASGQARTMVQVGRCVEQDEQEQDRCQDDVMQGLDHDARGQEQ